jgi:hypothetical protein
MSIGFGKRDEGHHVPGILAVYFFFGEFCNYSPNMSYGAMHVKVLFSLVFQMKFNTYMPILIHPHNQSSTIPLNLKMRKPLILKTKIAANILRKLTSKWILSSPGKIPMKFKIV